MDWLDAKIIALFGFLAVALAIYLLARMYRA
jgi:hypothetical protein